MGDEAYCVVKDLISFEAQENPPWRTTTGISVKDMLKEIMEFHTKWEKAKLDHAYDEQLVETVRFKFLVNFIYHINLEEEHGVSTLEETDDCLRTVYTEVKHALKRSLSIKEQETVNLKDAYNYLLEKIEREEKEGDYGLMETSLMKEAHRIILKNIPVPPGGTRPGKFSGKRRFTKFEGEDYEYPNPHDMELEVCKLLDRYNILFDSCTKDGLQDIDFYYSLFKSCAWALFELLDLHPFGDGNGRLCRLLCSYSLTKFCPFPTPIYNVWTESSKHDYKKALVEARKSSGRHPTALATMIIECNLHGWKEFFKQLDESIAG